MFMKFTVLKLGSLLSQGMNSIDEHQNRISITLMAKLYKVLSENNNIYVLPYY